MNRYRVTGRAIDDDQSVINLGSVIVEATDGAEARALGHNQLWDERLHIRAAHVVELLDDEEDMP